MYKIIKRENELVYVENTNTSEVYTLKQIFVHSELGKFYSFASILQMPFQRKAIFDMIRQYETIGVDKDELLTKTEDMMKLIIDKPKGWEQDVYTSMYNINSSLKNAWDYFKTASLIAALVIVPESELEMIGTFEQLKAQEYINLWSKDNAMFGFFLTIAQSKMNNFYNQLNTASLISVEQPQSMVSPTTSIKEEEQIKTGATFKNWFSWLQKRIIQSETD